MTYTTLCTTHVNTLEYELSYLKSAVEDEDYAAIMAAAHRIRKNAERVSDAATVVYAPTSEVEDHGEPEQTR